MPSHSEIHSAYITRDLRLLQNASHIALQNASHIALQNAKVNRIVH
ncbi:hypothetical protein GCM10007414_31640 [Agarivorans gilvus]|uniref:Uncharacterized protein n=1 Tax=Agarivorans gilvus TaxID=680279 RepID=A0ABQ1I613_9ALTE|nr:hypothetical protein GCM10007414_31640 [Agarivorans gilvus]